MRQIRPDPVPLFLSVFLIFFFGPCDGFCSMPPYRIFKITLVGEAKLNQPFEIKITVVDSHSKKPVKSASNKPITVRLLSHDLKPEIPKHIQILKGGKEWTMNQNEEYTLQIKVTEISNTMLFVSEKKPRFSGGIPSTPFNLLISRTSGVSYPGHVSPDPVTEKKIDEILKEIENDPISHNPAYSYRIFYYAPDGKLVLPKRGKQDKDKGKEVLPFYFVFDADFGGPLHISNENEVFEKAFNILLDQDVQGAKKILQSVKENTLVPENKIVFHNGWGVVYLCLGEWEKAKHEFATAVRLLEHYYEEIKVRSEKSMKWDLYHLDEIKKEKFLERVPFSHEELNMYVRLNFANIKVIKGRFNEAEKELGKAKIKRRLKRAKNNENALVKQLEEKIIYIKKKNIKYRK